MLPIWLLYFPAAWTAGQVLCQRFDSPTKAIVFMLAYHTMIPIFAFVVTAGVLGIIFLMMSIDPTFWIMVFKVGFTAENGTKSISVSYSF